MYRTILKKESERGRGLEPGSVGELVLDLNLRFRKIEATTAICPATVFTALWLEPSNTVLPVILLLRIND